MNNKLSRKEVEALLPDYIFNNLEEKEKSDFEISILEFPDLEQELREGIELFDKINKMDFEAIMNKNTDYLPDKVVDRLQRRNVPVYSLNSNRARGKWLLPLGIAAAVAFLYFFVNKPNDTIEVPVHAEIINKNSLFTELEKAIIFEDLININELNDIFYVSINDKNLSSQNNNTEIENIYYAVAEQHYIGYTENSAIISGCPDINQRVVIDNLANISESDFQIIMENLRNETN